MATYNDTYNAVVGNGTLLAQVTVACLNEAKTIFGELATTTNHANRIAWATRVVNGPQPSAQRMVLGVVLDATVSAALPGPVSDAAVQAAVSSLTDFFATQGL